MDKTSILFPMVAFAVSNVVLIMFWTHLLRALTA